MDEYTKEPHITASQDVAGLPTSEHMGLIREAMMERREGERRALTVMQPPISVTVICRYQTKTVSEIKFTIQGTQINKDASTNIGTFVLFVKAEEFNDYVIGQTFRLTGPCH